MTDDPLGSGAAIAHLKTGQKVWSLCFSGRGMGNDRCGDRRAMLLGLCPDQLHVAWMMEGKT